MATPAVSVRPRRRKRHDGFPARRLPRGQAGPRTRHLRLERARRSWQPGRVIWQRVSVEDAQRLIADGWIYLDVRSEEEFELARVPGSLNVPFEIVQGEQLIPNDQFIDCMNQHFGRGERLLLGCRSGRRSLHAAAVLEKLGFTELRELQTGFEGSRDAFGQLTPGWSRAGLPVETGESDGRSYRDILSRREPPPKDDAGPP